MTRSRLVLAVVLLAVVTIWLAEDYLRNLVSSPKVEARDERPPVTKLESIAIYPSATRVNLLIKNSRLDGVEISTNPNGVNLNKSQRQEFERSISKIVTVKPAGKDYPGEGMDACFIPHHFFRYFDSAGKKIGEIDICFCCSGGASDASLANGLPIYYDVAAIKRLVAKMRLPTQIGC